MCTVLPVTPDNTEIRVWIGFSSEIHDEQSLRGFISLQKNVSIIQEFLKSVDEENIVKCIVVLFKKLQIRNSVLLFMYSSSTLLLSRSDNSGNRFINDSVDELIEELITSEKFNENSLRCWGQ